MNEEIIKSAEEIFANRALKEQGYCVLALIDTDGYPTAATISPSKIEGIHCITFCTGTDSNWAKRIAKCNRASVCFNSGTEQYNITLVGKLQVPIYLRVRRIHDVAMSKMRTGVQEHKPGPFLRRAAEND